MEEVCKAAVEVIHEFLDIDAALAEVAGLLLKKKLHIMLLLCTCTHVHVHVDG